MARYQKTAGRYSLTAERDEDGFYHLIASAGTEFEYDAGLVADAENFDYAVQTAEEEMASLLADAREEFGF